MPVVEKSNYEQVNHLVHIGLDHACHVSWERIKILHVISENFKTSSVQGIHSMVSAYHPVVHFTYKAMEIKKDCEIP